MHPYSGILDNKPQTFEASLSQADMRRWNGFWLERTPKYPESVAAVLKGMHSRNRNRRLQGRRTFYVDVPLRLTLELLYPIRSPFLTRRIRPSGSGYAGAFRFGKLAEWLSPVGRAGLHSHVGVGEFSCEVRFVVLMIRKSRKGTP